MKQIIILVGLIFIVIGIVAAVISAFMNPAEPGKIVATFGGGMIAMCSGGLIVIVANAINEPIK